jgi:hypothetical protein
MELEKPTTLIPVSIFGFKTGLIVNLFICALIAGCTAKVSTLSPPIIPTFVPTESPVPTISVLPTPTPLCSNGLEFKVDLTIPDFSIIAPGSVLEKQWRVENSGSCNWDSLYRLRLVGGNALGASTEFALYPARAGMETTLEIMFKAPLEVGEYSSEWQAFDRYGVPFGDIFFIKIIVQ